MSIHISSFLFKYQQIVVKAFSEQRIKDANEKEITSQTLLETSLPEDSIVNSSNI